MFERFTDRARRVLVLALEEAQSLGHDSIGTEHILLGLSREADGVAAKALEEHGLFPEDLRAKVEERRPPCTQGSPGSPPFTARAKKVLELSLREALQLGHNYIGTEHLLLGLVGEGEGVGATALVAMGLDLDRVRQTVINALAGQPDSNIFAAVRGDLVDKTDLPVGAGALLGSAEAQEILRGWLEVEQRVHQTEVDGIVYETYTHVAVPPAQISVAVVGASVTRESFDRSTALTDDGEPVEGLGDGASYSPKRRSLRVLSGATVIVVRVTGHRDPRAAAVLVASRAVANLTGEGTAEI